MDEQYGDIVANIEKTLSDNREMMEGADKTIQTARKQGNNQVTIKFFTLAYYVLAMDTELKVLIRAMILDPVNSSVHKKYIALMLYEILRVQNGLYGEVRKEIDSLIRSDDKRGLAIDPEALAQAWKRHRERVAEIDKDRKFSAYLKRVRNNVVAHHTSHEEEGVDVLIEWYRDAADTETANLRHSDDQIISSALTVATSFHTLGPEMLEAISSDPVATMREYKSKQANQK